MLEQNILEAAAPGDPVALAFSGGTDSSCLLFSLIALGFEPTLYTYCVEGVESGDLHRARWMADHYGLRLVVALIPSDIPTLLRDTLRLARKYEGKVSVQCMHGHEYMAPLVEEPVIFNGSGIDGLYGAYKQFAFNGSKRNKVVFDQQRHKHLSNPNDDSMQYQQDCYAQHGAQVVFPYRQPNIIGFVMSKSWDELNRPRLKWILVRDYPEFQQFERYYRPRGSQQIEAGTRALHNNLLGSPLNVGHWKTVTPIYNRIYASKL